MKKMIFQVPGYLSKIESKTNSWKITVETQDTIPGEAINTFVEMKDKYGWFTFNVHQIQPEDIIDLPPIKPVEKGEKTPGQRLRAALYAMWSNNTENFPTADDHYRYYMEKFITHVKEKIDG